MYIVSQAKVQCVCVAYGTLLILSAGHAHYLVGRSPTVPDGR